MNYRENRGDFGVVGDIPQMFEDEIDDESNVEALVISWYYYTVLVLHSQSGLCKNCRRPGHFARDCTNVAICHNCGLPG